MKVLFVFGTRPEAIKMAPVIKAMTQQPEYFEICICVTAQHREMLDQILKLFAIQPDYDLNLMQPNQSLSQLTACMFSALDPIICQVKPNWLLVQGDTTTVMVASLVGYYHQIKVGHIEAGLRTYDKYQPFPEEINRHITGTIADLHFAPTAMARDNLLNEGIQPQTIQVTGNTVIDTLCHVTKIQFDFSQGPLATIPFDKRIILVTAHRRENFGQPLQSICQALKEIARLYPNIHLVYPVHLNPNVQMLVYDLLGQVPNITLFNPLDYLSFVHLMKQSYLVLTDSGGLQEEAPSLGKPVLVLRDTTERPEAIRAGTAKLVGTETQTIIQEVSMLLDDQKVYTTMAKTANPYGDGYASQRIAQALLTF